MEQTCSFPNGIMKRCKYLQYFFYFLPFFLAVNAGFSHKDPNAKVPSIHPLKVNVPMQVDGVLDEPFWKDAEVSSNFIDERSKEPQTQPTYIRIVYTQTHLYIALECMDDNMDEIRASERHEDRSFSGDDFVEVHFDPMHTHRQKYAFFTNPLGTKAEANEGPSGNFNYGWSAEWDCAAKMYKDRWVFEMKIPFGIMNYERKDNQAWGLNFTRVIRRIDSTGFWSFNATDFYKPRHFGHLTGLNLSDTKFDRNLEITPYVSSRVDFGKDTKTDFKTGVDTSFRLSPAITSSWSLYPDFGQVESDDDTIELRDTERFLPEKRLFFREGEEMMQMRNQLYYSRRFTDITAASKVSGQWNGHNFVFEDIFGDVKHGDYSWNGNNTVFRFLQNVGEKSNVGYYVADSEFDRGNSRVAGVDGTMFLADEWQYRFQGSMASDRIEDAKDIEIKDRTDFLGMSTIEYKKFPWEIDFNYTGITKGFDPALGYIPRQNIFGPSAEVTYFYNTSNSWYRSYMARFYTQLYQNDLDETSIRDYNFDTQLVFKNDIGINLGHDINYHAPYDNTRTSAGVIFFSSDFWKTFGINAATGVFEKTDYNEVSVDKHFKPFDRLPIRYEFAIRFEEQPITHQDDTVWLNRIVFDYYFTDKMWIKSSIQQRADSIHNLSLIYGWEFKKNAHWYLVFNSVNDGANPDTVNSIFSKIAYTF